MSCPRLHVHHFAARLMMPSENVLHRVGGPIDGRKVPIPTGVGERVPGFPRVSSPAALAVEHEASQPLAARIEIQRKRRFAAAADLAAIHPLECFAGVGRFPNPFTGDDHVHISRCRIDRHSGGHFRPRLLLAALLNLVHNRRRDIDPICLGGPAESTGYEKQSSREKTRSEKARHRCDS